MVNNDTPRLVVRIIADNIINENIFTLLVENYSYIIDPSCILLCKICNMIFAKTYKLYAWMFIENQYEK
jgi:tRNA A37 threonylcarbamoyladenosine dehydratase